MSTKGDEPDSRKELPVDEGLFKKGMDIVFVHEKELRRFNTRHKRVLETVSGSHDVKMRTKKSTISCMTNKLDDTMLEKHNIILSHDTAVLSSVKDAKATKRNHHSAQMRSKKTKFGKVAANLSKTKSLVSTLINRSVTAERGTSKPNTLANRSVKRSQDVQESNNTYQEELKEIHAENVKLREAMSRLTDPLEESEKKMASMKAEVPI